MSQAPGLDQHDEPEIHKSTEDRLVYMANQIAGFFASQGHEDRGVAAVADHLRSYWDPSMFRRIYAHLDSTGGEGLKPMSLQALKMLRQSAPGEVRAELERTGGRSGTEPGDDAG